MRLLTLPEIQVLALKNPWGALAYLLSPNAQPVMLYMSAQWTVGTAEQNIEGTVPNRLCDDMFVWDAVYQVQSPTVNDDNLLFKGQQDVNNALNPCIQALIQISGDCPRFTLTDNFVPIEMQARCASSDQADMSWAGGWIAPRKTVMAGNFINQRAWTTGDSGEVTVTVWYALRGFSVGCPGIWGRPVVDVLEMLAVNFGIDHPVRAAKSVNAAASLYGSPWPSERKPIPNKD